MSASGGLDEPFVRVDAERGKALWEAGGLTWIDVREAAEWGAARIPGARLVPLHALLSAPRAHLQGVDGVVIYCAEGIRSAVACEIAAALGLGAVYNLDGGIDDWIRRGNPVER
jgi:rhodanese-related sulfurtransferase